MHDLVQPLVAHFFERSVLSRVMLCLNNRHETVVADRLAVFGLFRFEYANECPDLWSTGGKSLTEMWP